MAQGFINFSTKHAVAGSTRLAATKGVGAHGPIDLQISKDLDNGTIIGKGALVAGEVYAMASPTSFAGKIIDKAANGNWYVEVTSASNAYLVLQVPVTYYDYTNQMRQESTFYNENGDIVRAYPLFAGDVFELSDEGFDGTPAKDATVSVDSTTYQVEVQ